MNKKKTVLTLLISLTLIIIFFAFLNRFLNLPQKAENVPNNEENLIPTNQESKTSSPQNPEIALENIKSVEPEVGNINTKEEKESFEFTISCASILGKKKEKILPEKGVIFSGQIKLEEKKTAYDILKEITRKNNIQMEVSETPVYGSIYIEGINNIYEFDYGATSGWTYRVNGKAPDVACNKYVVNPKDKIEFIYVCEWQNDM